MSDNLPLLYRLLRRTRTLDRVNFTHTIAAAGRSYRAPVRGGLGRGLLMGEHDPWKLSLLRVALRRPGTFVDVGANVGQTLLGVRALDPNRPYVACEPNPPVAALLDELVRLNRLADPAPCHVVPAGLSGAPGLLTLHEHAAHPEIASTTDGFRPASSYTHARHVPVLRGDDVLNTLLSAGPAEARGTASIKIDVEGGELDVLRGLTQTLSADRPSVFCEILPVPEDGAGEIGELRRTRQDELLALMAGLDYRLFRTLHDGRLEAIPCEPGGVKNADDLTRCDYLFVQPGDAAAFESA